MDIVSIDRYVRAAHETESFAKCCCNARRSEPLSNPYRPAGVAVDMVQVRAHLRPDGNTLAVAVS